MWENEIPKKHLERIRAFRLMDDDFMSACFDGNKECTELVLHIILGRQDLKVESVQTQRSLKNLEKRSIKLDIFARDAAGKAYDIEIQRSDRGAGMQRARFYSSLIDATLLDPGDDFSELPETYVIFITEKDVLHEGFGLYHFDRVCRETGKVMQDGAHIIYVNGEHRDDTPLGVLMHDFACSNPKDIKYKVLADRTRYFKQTEEGARSMCRIMDKIQEETKLSIIFNMLDDDLSPLKIARYVHLPVDEVEDIIRKIQSGEIVRPQD